MHKILIEVIEIFSNFGQEFLLLDVICQKMSIFGNTNNYSSKYNLKISHHQKRYKLKICLSISLLASLFKI